MRVRELVERSLDFEPLFDGPSRSQADGDSQVWVVVSRQAPETDVPWIDREACQVDTPLRICPHSLRDTEIDS